MIRDRRSLLLMLVPLAVAACGGGGEDIETFDSGPAAVPLDATSKDFGLLEAPTKTTRGLT